MAITLLRDYLLTHPAHCVAFGAIHFQFDSCDRQVTTHNSRSIQSNPNRSDPIPSSGHVRFFIYATALRGRGGGMRYGAWAWGLGQGITAGNVCQTRFIALPSILASLVNGKESDGCDAATRGTGLGALAFLCHNIIDDIVF